MTTDVDRRALVEWSVLARSAFTGLCADGIDLSGLDVSGTVWKRALLRGASLRGTDASRADLSDAILSGAHSSGRGASLRGATLSRATVDGWTIGGEVDMRDVVAQNVDWSEAIIDGGGGLKDVSGGDWSGCALGGVVGRGTVCHKTQFQSVRIESGRDVSGIDAAESVWDGAQLAGVIGVQ
jgi:uncharacterized protein YjbI with pentapeptide repeats